MCVEQTVGQIWASGISSSSDKLLDAQRGGVGAGGRACRLVWVEVCGG